MKLKHLLGSLLGIVTILSPLTAATVHAYAPSNTLIKTASSPALYWYASNGYRYVFPNLRTYYSWFSSNDFARVITVNTNEMTAIPLGGNVTYRPGAKMVKIQTDPRVYVVARHGVLRWISNEALAQQIYGYNWRSLVEDIPDAFFANYTVGAPIYNTSDYNVSNEYNGVNNPSDSLPDATPVYSNPYNNPNYNYNPLFPSYPPVVSTPYSNPSFRGTLTAYLTSSNLTVGQSTSFYAQINNPSSNAQNLRINLLDQNGATLKTCYQTSFCDVMVYAASNGSSRVYYAQAFNERNEMIESNRVTLYTSYSYQNGNTYPRSFSGYSLNVNNSLTSGVSGQIVSVTATVTPTPYDLSNTSIEIRNQSTNELVRRCYNVSSCQTDANLPSINQTFNYYAMLIDSSGNTYLTGYSPSIVVSTNASFNGSASITTDRSSYRSGDQITLTAYVSNYTNNLSNTQLEVWGEQDGLYQTCSGTTVCTVYPRLYTSTGNAFTTRFFVRVKDNATNQYLPTAYTSYVTIYP